MRGAARSNPLHFERVIPQLLSLLSIVSLILLIILVVTKPPSDGYEPHVASSYGPFLRASMYGVLTGAILSLAWSDGRKDDILRNISVVVFGYLVWFFLPVFRGYVLYGRGKADVLSHVGRTRTLLTQGFVPDRIPYSALYYVLAPLRLLRTEYVILFSTTAFVFTLVHILGTFAIIRKYTGSSQPYGLLAAVPLPLIYTSFHRSTHPGILSMLLVPIVFLMYHRLKEASGITYLAATVLTFLCMVQFHPVTAVLLFLLLLISDFTEAVRPSGGFHRYSALPAAFFIILMAWYSRTGVVRTVLAQLLLVRGESDLKTSSVSAVQQTDLSGFDMIVRILEIYGGPLLYIFTGGLAAISVILHFIRHNEDRYRVEFFLYYVGGGLTAVGFYIVDLVVRHPIRATKYLLFASIALIGVSIPRWLSIGPKTLHYIQATIVTMVVLLSALVTVGAVYQPGNHLTHTEVEGSDWFLENHSSEFDTRSYDMGAKTEVYIEGSFVAQRDEKPFQAHNQKYRIPKRLGYVNGSSPRSEIERGTYIITKSHDYKFYKWYPEQRRGSKLQYTRRDRNRLANEKNVNKMYANGAFTVWFLN